MEDRDFEFDDDTFPNVRPEIQPPLGEEEFEFAVDIGLAAGQLDMPTETPRNSGINLRHRDGSNQGIRFTDTPENRAMLAIRKHFRETVVDESTWRQKATSANWRFMGILILIHGKKLGKWVRDSEEAPGSLKIHPAVIRTAARLPLTKQGKFATRAFLRQVALTAEEHSGDQW